MGYYNQNYIAAIEETIENIRQGKDINVNPTHLKNITMQRYYYELFKLYEAEEEDRY
jgi:hypothetical protein